MHTNHIGYKIKFYKQWLYFDIHSYTVHTVRMTEEYDAYGVPCLNPPCKVSKLKITKDETDHGADEQVSETQFLQHKTKGRSF